MKKKRRSRQFKNSSRVIDMDEARHQRRQRRQEQLKEVEMMADAITERRLRRKRALRKKQSIRRIIMVAAAALMAIAIGASLVNVIVLQKQKHDLNETQQQLIDERKALTEELKHITDEETLEDEAREKLRLIKPGETIYILNEN